MKNKIAMTKWAGGAMLAGVSLMSLPALAQNADNLDVGSASVPAEQEANTARLPITISSGVSEQFNTDFDKGGSFSITRFKVSGTVPIRLNDDFTLSSTLRYGLDSYDFDTIGSLWHNINTLAASSILSWRMDNRWSIYGGGFVKMSAESTASLGQGTTGGGIAGFNYKFNDTLSLGGGFAVMSVLEDDARVIPIITAKWQFADKWRLDAGLTDVATYGYGVNAKWLFNDNFDFNFGAQYHDSRFRVSAANDGVGQEKAATLYAGATWHATPKFDVTGYFGLAVDGNVQIDTHNGREIADSDYDPAPILGLNASYRF